MRDLINVKEYNNRNNYNQNYCKADLQITRIITPAFSYELLTKIYSNSKAGSLSKISLSQWCHETQLEDV